MSRKRRTIKYSKKRLCLQIGLLAAVCAFRFSPTNCSEQSTQKNTTQHHSQQIPQQSIDTRVNKPVKQKYILKAEHWLKRMILTNNYARQIICPDRNYLFSRENFHDDNKPDIAILVGKKDEKEPAQNGNAELYIEIRSSDFSMMNVPHKVVEYIDGELRAVTFEELKDAHNHLRSITEYLAIEDLDETTRKQFEYKKQAVSEKQTELGQIIIKAQKLYFRMQKPDCTMKTIY